MTQTWLQLLAKLGILQLHKCYCRGCSAPGTHQMAWCYSDEIEMQGDTWTARVKHPSEHWLCDKHYAHWVGDAK